MWLWLIEVDINTVLNILLRVLSTTRRDKLYHEWSCLWQGLLINIRREWASVACLRTGQPRTLSDDRGNAALERRGLRMPAPTKHHRDKRVILDPVPSPFSYACIQGKIATDCWRKESSSSLVNSLVPGRNLRRHSLSRAGVPVSHPIGTPLQRADVYKFHPYCLH